MASREVLVGLGEVLWDVFPEGARFGGAPANFACSAAKLAGVQVEVHVVSAVGDDDLGVRARESLESQGVLVGHLSTLAQRTGQVDVTLDDDGHASYVFASDTAWDNLEWSTGLEEMSRRTSAVCFGTLGQRGELSRATIRRFVEHTPPSALRIFDINLRPPFFDDEVILASLALANVLKLNDDELPVVARLTGVSGSEAELLRQIADHWQLSAVALTRGATGAVLLRGSELNDSPGTETVVRDTVGAGDAFTATLALGLLRQMPLSEINRAACRVAAFVCSQPGATPPFPDELRAMLQT